ncbi:DUF6705 family protein [Riemerella columbipharyngis]|uniref:DUF6705 domain-containing protein n=1 Tax=Riemerella columbipharyngis TaxID=1071918 RepID=A0A1G6YCZ3_9FLAO|nr:DUF6705 family protein [Riemerella columbipharyngis]SDD87863.1 hypothetical protein SAMN05421544_101104 [Riemerella columbipharyngis]
MKKVILITTLFVACLCKAQTYTLRTTGVKFPKDSYVKDTNNELPEYEGTWKGTWGGKMIYLTFKKIKYYNWFLNDRAYYRDMLIGKFKVLDQNNKILFDNTNVSDNDARIKGFGFMKTGGKYLLGYIDEDICYMNGRITIYFTDNTKKKLQWDFYEGDNLITPDCRYYKAKEFPQPLPKSIVLTKQ